VAKTTTSGGGDKRPTASGEGGLQIKHAMVFYHFVEFRRGGKGCVTSICPAGGEREVGLKEEGPKGKNRPSNSERETESWTCQFALRDVTYQYGATFVKAFQGELFVPFPCCNFD